MASDPARHRETTYEPVQGPLRYVLVVVAWVSLVLGLIGVVTPVLPTVPFILLAAWAASRSSPRLHEWMESHPRFGHHIRDWREGGVVSRSAKWMATVFMSGSAVMMFFVVPHRWLVAAVVATMAAVLAWLWRRPEEKDAAAGSP